MWVLVLESLGDVDASGRFYRAIDAWARAERGKPGESHHSCHWIEVCEYLGTVEKRLGNTKRAKEHIDWIPIKFTVAWSGASATAGEIDTIKDMAFDIGLMRERQGLFDIASAYFQIAGASTDAIVASKDPLRAVDDIKAAGPFARVLYKTGDPVSARQVTSHLVKAARRRFENSASFGSDAVIRWAERLRPVFETHLATTPKGEDGSLRPEEDAFFATQYLQNTRTASTLAKLSARMGTVAGDAARAHQQTGAKLAAAYSGLITAKGAQKKKLLRDIEKLEAKSAALTKELREKHPAYFSHGRVQTLTIAQARAALKPGEALLTATAGRDEAYVWWITKDTVSLRRLDKTPTEISGEIAAYRAAIEGLEPLTPAALRLGHSLYQSLLGPVASQLDTIKHISFVPNGSFDGLPLSALLSEPVETGVIQLDELREKKLPWLIRKFAVSTLPSVAALSILRSGAPVSPVSRPFLGVGNPNFGSDVKVVSSRRVVTLDKDVSIPPLPESEDEVRKLASLLKADPERDLLIGNIANEEEVKTRALSDYRILAFATHGVIAGEVKTLDEPALVLSIPKKPTRRNDGFLTASEIAGLEMNADLVILSACNTASGDGAPGAEGLSGLANAFFFAGARGLIATRWFIPSEPAVEVTTGMVEAKVDNEQLNWAEALRQSVLRLIDEPGPAINAHPIGWGAFIAVGVQP